MKQILIISLLLSNAIVAQEQKIIEMKTEPKCKKSTHELTEHGNIRKDDYFWMNERDAPEVLEYIGQENKHAEAYFKQSEKFRNDLLDEFEARINPNDIGAPFEYNGKTYQVRNLEGKDYQVIYQLNGEQESLFIDENQRAENQSYYDLADWVPSPNNELLAISEDLLGRRNYTISVRKNIDGSFLNDRISNTDGSIVWANNNQTLYYVKKDPETLREFQVYRHLLGTDEAKDELIYEEKDEKFHVYISKTLTHKYIEITCESSLTSEVHFLDADESNPKPKVFLKRNTGHLYSVEHHEEGYYITSNHLAKNNRLLFSSDIPASIDNCTEVIAHRKDVLLEHVLVLQKFLISKERSQGLTQLRMYDLKSKKEKTITFDEETYTLDFASNDNYNSSELYFSYTSLTTPASIFNYNLVSDTRVLHFQKRLLDPTFSPDDYTSERIWATANDGTKIAISLVYKKGIILKDAPLLLYGYGSYGITIPDGFNPYRLSLLNRGFVYAIAHIRGEKYLGEEWYENGKFLKKKNTFTDFINAAEFLGMKGYCNKNSIYAQGGSAGGLLMGAVINMAPYLFKGVIAQVPFVDVVTTMLDESIPLTVGEYDEWGNPNEADFYWYMLSYSPYDNVRSMDYPALLVTTGYHDSQVQYWEPLKWVAKLRELKTNQLPLIFDCNMDAGHGGGSGRSSERMEIAKNYAFILEREGLIK